MPSKREVPTCPGTLPARFERYVFWAAYGPCLLLFGSGVIALIDAFYDDGDEHITDHTQKPKLPAPAPGIEHKAVSDVLLNVIGHFVWWTPMNRLIGLTYVIAVIVLVHRIALHLVNNALSDMTRSERAISIMTVEINRTSRNRLRLLRVKRFILQSFVAANVFFVGVSTATCGPVFAVLILMAILKCGKMAGKALALLERVPDFKERER